MTYLDIALILHSEMCERCIIGMFCPGEMIPGCDIVPQLKDGFISRSTNCSDCWHREAPAELIKELEEKYGTEFCTKETESRS